LREGGGSGGGGGGKRFRVGERVNVQFDVGISKIVTEARVYVGSVIIVRAVRP
jgi:hypothetical protein